MKNILLAVVLIITGAELFAQTNNNSSGNTGEQVKPGSQEKFHWFSAGVGAYGAHGSRSVSSTPGTRLKRRFERRKNFRSFFRELL